MLKVFFLAFESVTEQTTSVWMIRTVIFSFEGYSIIIMEELIVSLNQYSTARWGLIFAAGLLKLMGQC